MSVATDFGATSTAGARGASPDPELQREVAALLAEEMNIELAQVSGETTLEELGVQSIDFVDLLFAIETHFGVELPNLAADDRPLNTVADVTTLVAESLASLKGT